MACPEVTPFTHPFLCSQDPNLVHVFLITLQFFQASNASSALVKAALHLEPAPALALRVNQNVSSPLCQGLPYVRPCNIAQADERVLKREVDEGAPLLLLGVIMSASCYKTAAPVLDLEGSQPERRCQGWRGRKRNVKEAFDDIRKLLLDELHSGLSASGVFAV